MDAYASVGMPINYRHWSFGKHFLSTEKSYKRGQMGLAYEIVINSNPCIAYLMEENTMTMQALVIAHACYGHNSFFKGNYLFRPGPMPRHHRLPGVRQELHRRVRGALRARRGGRTARLLPRADELRRRPLQASAETFAVQGGGAAARARGVPAVAGQRAVAHPAGPQARVGRRGGGGRAIRPSRRRTCCISSRRTRRCWSPGSAR